jgi:predicted neuraminidase
MMRVSNDDGRTWSPAKSLPAGIFGPIKDKPIELDDGRILCGSSDESDGWTVHFEWTRDLGETWSRTDPINSPVDFDAIQPAVMKGRNHRLIAVGRTQQKRVFFTASADEGQTWDPLSLLDVPNPDSGLDAVGLSDGRFLMVFNESEKWRTPLNVALSNDGVSWRTVLSLERRKGEFSYPAVIQTRDGMVHVTYTWNRKRIRHVVIDPTKLD